LFNRLVGLYSAACQEIEMQSSQKYLAFAGVGLAVFFLILPGLGLAIASASSNPSLAPLLHLDSCEGCAVSTPLAAHIEKNSNGKGGLEEQLRLLLEELKQLEKDVEEKFRKDILPYLKREIEKLRNRLKEFSPGKEEAPRPQRVQA
jgi:hypothetical protein